MILWKVGTQFTWILLILVLDTRPLSLEFGVGGFAGGLSSLVLNYMNFHWVFRKFHLPLHIWSAIKYSRNYNLTVTMNLKLCHSVDTHSANIDSILVSDKDQAYTSNSIKNSSSADSVSTPKQSSSISATTVTLRDILLSKHGFHVFARHLTREFSIENLLFFVETHQWLRTLLSNRTFSSYSIIPNAENLLNIEFHEKVPQSNIVLCGSENDDEQKQEYANDDTVYIQCVQLFKKYICNDAYFCVNISYPTRMNIYSYFDYSDGLYPHSRNDAKAKSAEMKNLVNSLKKSVTNGDQMLLIFKIFENARHEIFQLLHHSFARFKYSDECSKFLIKSSEQKQNDIQFLRVFSLSSNN